MKTLSNWHFDSTWTSAEQRSALTLGKPGDPNVLPLDFKWHKTDKEIDFHGIVAIDQVWLSLVNPVTHEFFEIIRYDEYAQGYTFIEPDSEHRYGHNKGTITRQFLVLERDTIDDHGAECPEELGVLCDTDLLKIKALADYWQLKHDGSEYLFWSIENGCEMDISDGESVAVSVLKLH